jgi:hypothetical protein
LWAQNKTSFQRAFAKSGRIDVDPECKWLIHTAVDASVRALMLDIADVVARGGSMASALGGGRNKGSTNAEKAGGQVSPSESDRQSGSSTSVDVHVATIVSQALMAQFCIDDGVVRYRIVGLVVCSASRNRSSLLYLRLVRMRLSLVTVILCSC